MHYLASINVSQLKVAAEEQSQKQEVSDVGIRRLLKHLKVSTACIVGSNQSQASIHSKIWSLSIKLGPPSMWVTINPSDLHNLIAQVFVERKLILINLTIL